MSSTQFIGFESIMVILEVSMLLWPCRTFQVYFCHFTLGGGGGFILELLRVVVLNVRGILVNLKGIWSF